MFRSADPGNEHLQEEPGQSAGELYRPATRGCIQIKFIYTPHVSIRFRVVYSTNQFRLKYKLSLKNHIIIINIYIIKQSEK